MNLALAAQYLGLSPDSLLTYVSAGELEPVRPRRADTPRAWRQRPANDTLRRLLFDKADLDRLADGWR